jgi:hypothetical protein
MGNSTLKAHFNPAGEFTSVTIDNKYGAAGAKTSVDYKPDMSKIRNEKDWYNKWFKPMRATIHEDFDGATIDDLYIANLKYVDENDESLNFECDLYELHPDSDYDDVVKYALEAAYDFFSVPFIDEKIYCKKYVEYFEEDDAWGIKLDNIEDMVESCTKENLYKVKTISQGLAKIYYNNWREVGVIEQYTSGGKNFEGKWGAYWHNNYAFNYGQESDRWTSHDFFGETRKEAAEQMIDEDWKRRLEKLNVK